MTDHYEQQVPFGTDSFADNPEPRCPCLLLLDTSGSMSGAPIGELNNGLITLKNELVSDQLARKRVELAIITFGPVNIVSTFHTVENFLPPSLQASGDTPMGAAIQQGLAILKNRKEEYRRNGISFYRPWVFLITDGAPTDSWQGAASDIHEGETSKSFAFFAVGVKGANMEILAKIAPPNRPPVMLEGLRFRELFQWLSNSMKSVSHSTPGDKVQIVPPTGWTEV